MSKKSELAAMKYLADKKPKKYQFKTIGKMAVLEIWDWAYGCFSEPMKRWKLLHTVDLSENNENRTN